MQFHIFLVSAKRFIWSRIVADGVHPHLVLCTRLRETVMSKKLFVGGLAWATTSDGLRKAFELFGEVTDAKVITDRETNRSRGFGFVTFTEDDAAAKAITEMDGKELDGRTIRVNEANQTKPAGGQRRPPRHHE